MSEIIPINMDRISSLPDSLLCHILSFLPIKESVATSILSRSWRHRWKDLQVFAFKEEFFRRRDLSSREVYMRFVAFVDTVLEQRRFPHIEKFSLVCKTIEQDIFTRWISEAIESHLQELCIAVQDGSSAMEISLPDSLFTCTSLVSLSLDKLSRYLYHIPFVHLPSLKNLELYIHFADIDLADIDNLFLGCPVLEKLELRFFLLCISTIHIPPTLKSLTIEEEYYSVSDDYMIECIELVTPSLEYLYIQIHTKCLKIVVCNFANMVEAHLDISLNDSHAGWVPQLLKAVSSAKFLVLRESTTKCLLCAPVLDLPEFRHLVKLQIYFSPFNSNFMMNMLKKCHVLQVLTIWDVKASHRRILPVPTVPFIRQASHRRILPVPTDVPNCLLSHLTTVNFSFYHFSEVELEFIAYILHNGLVLEEVRIRFYPRDYSMIKHRIWEELSLVPRGSWTCRVYL